jgi:hypothetical protein
MWKMCVHYRRGANTFACALDLSAEANLEITEPSFEFSRRYDTFSVRIKCLESYGDIFKSGKQRLPNLTGICSACMRSEKCVLV